MDKEELINGYFEGSLSQDRLEEVTRLLESNPEFASEFEFQKELQNSLRKEERKEIKTMFNTLSETDKMQEKSEGKVISMRPWLAAASIALLIGLASWLFIFNSSDLNTDALYAANFAPYDNVIHPIERGNQLEDLKTRAFTAYENGEYPEALELFKELYEKHNDSYIDFYSAMVLMQLNQQEEAIPLLEKYIENKGELKDRASWYLSLAYLKIDNIKASKVALNELIQSGTFRTKAARELLEQLE